MTLLWFILETTYWVYEVTFYKQIQAVLWVLLSHPSLYMEQFKQDALTSFTRPPEICFRYVDDVFSKLHEYESVTGHLNSRESHIQFTTEPESDGRLAFLDTSVQVLPDGSPKVHMYRKPTHTDQYLYFNSNHHLEHKRSVVRTLFHRADTIISMEADMDREKKHTREVFLGNNYEQWMITNPMQKTSTESRTSTASKISVSFPYVQGASEKRSKVFKKQVIAVYHKPFNTLRSQRVHPKDPTPIDNRCGVIYKISCDQCHMDYIGKTARSFGTRLKEHSNIRRSSTTAVGEHCRDNKHTVSLDNLSIISMEDNWLKRTVKEANRDEKHEKWRFSCCRMPTFQSARTINIFVKVAIYVRKTNSFLL